MPQANRLAKLWVVQLMDYFLNSAGYKVNGLDRGLVIQIRFFYLYICNILCLDVIEKPRKQRDLVC